MKKIFFLLLLIVSFSNLNAQHGNHWKVVTGNYPNGYWNYPCVPGDTLYLQGVFTYMAFGGIGDTTKATIAIITDSAIFKWNGNPTQGVGFNFADCNNFHITGAGTGDEAGYHLHIKNAPGVAVSISGKSNWFEVDHLDIDTAFYFVWFKDEPRDHACDSSYWYGHNVMTGLYLHDMKEHYCHQDGNYLGSTDQQADRNVVCNGITYHPLPAQVKNVRVARLWIRDVQRSAIQLSGGIGNNYIDSNDIAGTGFEFNSNQGTAITIGGNTHSDSITDVSHNKIRGTYLYNFFSQGYGVISFHDNDCDSAGYIYGIPNGQQIPSANFSSYHTNTTWKIYNNKMGVNSSRPYTNIALYATTSQMTPNNVVCNSGAVTNGGQSFTYDTSCGFIDTAAVYDTTYETVHVMHDTTKMEHFRDSITIVDSTHPIYNVKARTVTRQKLVFPQTITTVGTKIFSHKELRTWDSLVLIHNGADHDSTIMHITVVYNKTLTNYGVFDNNGIDNTTQQKIARAKALGCQTARYPFNRGQTNYQVAAYKTAGLKVSMTFNWDAVSAVAAYPTDTARVGVYLDSLFLVNKTALPDYLFIANEPANPEYHVVDGPAYVKFLTVCVRIAKKYNIPISIGGSTQDIIYPMNEYYLNHSLTDSVAWLAGIFGTLNTGSGTYIAKKNFYAALIPAATTLGLFAWNFHPYEWPTTAAMPLQTTTSGLIAVSFDFIKLQTRLDAVTDEWGTRNTQSALMTATMNEIRSKTKRLMIYYLSDNSSYAKNNEAAYQSYITANP